jgi:hypothetical protein
LCLSLTSTSANFAQQHPTTGFFTQRLYTPSGMIPKYTGYLPRMNFRNSYPSR